jgi:hypothetical protein
VLVVLHAVLLVLIGCTVNKYRLIGRFEQAYDPLGGDYVTLEEKLFGLRACLTGLLEPKKFDEAIGFKILLEEPHDPARIPVLMVHGHLTGPRAMEHVGPSLDRTRFEPWYAYFPAGYGVDHIARRLRASLAKTAAHEGVSSIGVVTYSLGGLIVRAALKPDDGQLAMPEVPVFIAASTPWAGTRRVGRWAWAAEAPESWKDMKPGSDFLAHLFDEPLPPSTEMHVLCGSGGNTKWLYGDDDSVVEVEALLTPEVLEEAATVMHYDYLAHFDMVSHPEPLARINDLLEDAFPE